MGITDYYARKRENHEMAMKLWAEHASPIMKGEVLKTDQSAVTAANHLDVGKKGGDANSESAKMFGKMSRAERVAYRERQKAKKNAEKRDAKEKKEDERRKKEAEKEHRKKTKADERQLAHDMLDEKKAERELQAKLAKGGMSEKVRPRGIRTRTLPIPSRANLHVTANPPPAPAVSNAPSFASSGVSQEKNLARMLASGNKKLARRNQITQKYGKGKITKQGNDDTTDRKKADAIIPKVPGQQVGFTEGVTNVMGVYRWNNEVRDG